MRARVGTLFVGIAALLGVAASIPLLRYFKRTTFIKTGEIIMGTCLLASGIMALLNYQFMIIILTMIFVFGFNCGLGPILYIYSSETLDSYGCSVVGLINMFMTWIFGTFTNLGTFFIGY